jgi:hypothetical protein
MNRDYRRRVDFLASSLWEMYGKAGRWDQVEAGLFGAKMILFDDVGACADMDSLAAIARRHLIDGYRYEGQQE